MVVSLVLLTLLSQAVPEEEPFPEKWVVPDEEEAVPEEEAAAGSPGFIEYLFARGSLDVSGLVWRERSLAHLSEGFLSLLPNLTVDGGDRFGFELQAPLRLRVFTDSGPARNASSGLWRIRSKDWDELSDFGQLLHFLRLGADESPVALQAGFLEDYTLRSGHLVSRYSNQTNPDYHPSGAFLTAQAGPLYTELFTSDVLGARLVAGELSLDVGPWLGAAPTDRGRHTVSLSLAHDFARAGGVSPPLTVAHADGLFGLIYLTDFQLLALVGAGTRLGGPNTPAGAVAGLRLEMLSRKLWVSARLEARMQRGGFRQGFFGPFYELSRFAAPGPSLLPAADALWPDGYSGFGELLLGWDSLSLDHGERELNLSLTVEAFSWGRIDADARVETRLLVRTLRLALRVAGEGMKQPGARYVATGEVRYRLLKRLYVMAQGGTVFFPQADSSVLPSAFASLGLGADYIR